VDPNAGVELYESNDIIRHLSARYGSPSAHSRAPGALTLLSASLASAWRSGHGRSARPSKRPARLLELWGHEASPAARLAREVLCELELPYRLCSLGAASSKRSVFVQRFGAIPVPVLVDPNSGRVLHAGDDIAGYLRETYAA
jgi:glutathione S-transferase